MAVLNDSLKCMTAMRQIHETSNQTREKNALCNQMPESALLMDQRESTNTLASYAQRDEDDRYNRSDRDEH